MFKKDINNLEDLQKLNKSEYNLVNFLDKIGLFFKYSLFLFFILMFFYSLYIFFFSLDNLTPTKNSLIFKKGVINISFSSKNDFKLSKDYLKDYNSLLYGKLSSPKLNYDNRFIPIYKIDLKSRGYLYALRYNFLEKDILGDEFYILKNKKDNSAYRRDNIVTPKLSELYSGKVVFESFFNFPYIDFINLVSGIIFSEELYKFKYSQKLSELSLFFMKQQKGFFISSYNNTDSTSHKDLLKSFSIYYRNENFIDSIKKGEYFLANELVASGKQFNFEIKDGYLYYNIYYKEKEFKVLIFRDGEKISTSYKNHNKIKLKKGLYRVIVLKLESHLFFKTELFTYYFNIEI